MLLGQRVERQRLSAILQHPSIAGNRQRTDRALALAAEHEDESAATIVQRVLSETSAAPSTPPASAANGAAQKNVVPPGTTRVVEGSSPAHAFLDPKPIYDARAKACQNA